MYKAQGSPRGPLAIGLFLFPSLFVPYLSPYVDTEVSPRQVLRRNVIEIDHQMFSSPWAEIL